MKYIYADHLKAEIEKHIKEVKDAAVRFTPNMGFFDAKLSGIYDVMAIIDSLQQEQLEIDKVRELREDISSYCTAQIKDSKTTATESEFKVEQARRDAYADIDEHFGILAENLPEEIEEEPADLGKTVEFECIGKKVKMTVQELINYYIDTECADVADECGF